MENFSNLSAFPAMLFDSFDQNDHGFSTVVARVSYDLDIATGALTLCDDQGELVEQDLNYGEPGYSSVRFESDLAPYKPWMDVVINASAWAPQDKPARSFTVGAQIGDTTRLLRIHGPREWWNVMAGWRLTDPEPLQTLELRYEYAAGGMYTLPDDQVVAAQENTVGMGWYPREVRKHLKKDRLPAPQIEWVTQPVKKMDEAGLAAGFGFYGRGWKGRIEHAGTYDENWKQNRHPFLPKDFRFDYWCGAHPLLQFPLPAPLSAIPVTLKYLISARDKADQEIRFQVPVESLFVFIMTQKGAGVAQDMTLDTLVVDVPARKVHCSYRTVISELMEPVMTELRFVAREERHAQVVRARQLLSDRESADFLPLPPSLLNLNEKRGAHG
ncbi:DUF2169 domain-containing protein [Cronobacter sakazakii]|uniref:DUF2169 family type VI secretion system accessory protein n=1 Tax=Cronobacter sakazakii TaxID=28141 RepID=UPI000D7087C9|nr:DUF2169 domain-containing protein [Cronobacter sakazakii]ELY4221681.1 DUF2169 domain-containing protein [Cronobacter sakazakii]MBR9958333.1 DUF2169 domain-containing protein [Cronobacter sakazakii]PWV27278.1 DUF2169 domain-containing protein [Cronobacter sakazakii]